MPCFAKVSCHETRRHTHCGQARER